MGARLLLTVAVSLLTLTWSAPAGVAAATSPGLDHATGGWAFVEPLHHETTPLLGAIPAARSGMEVYSLVSFQWNYKASLTCEPLCLANYASMRWSVGADWAVHPAVAISVDMPLLFAWWSAEVGNVWAASERAVDLGNLRVGTRYVGRIPFRAGTVYITPSLRVALPTDTVPYNPERYHTSYPWYMPSMTIEPGVAVAVKVGRFSPYLAVAVPVQLTFELPGTRRGDGARSLVDIGAGVGIAVAASFEVVAAWRLACGLAWDDPGVTSSVAVGARFWLGQIGLEATFLATPFGNDETSPRVVSSVYGGDFAASAALIWAPGR